MLFDQLNVLMIVLIVSGLIIWLRQLFCMIQLMLSGVSDGDGVEFGVYVRMVVGSILVIVENVNLSVIVSGVGVVVLKRFVFVVLIVIDVVVIMIFGCVLCDSSQLVVRLLIMYVVMIVVLISFVVLIVRLRCCIRNIGRNVIIVKNCMLQVVKFSVRSVVECDVSMVCSVGLMCVVVCCDGVLVDVVIGIVVVVMSVSVVVVSQLLCQLLSSGLISIDSVMLVGMKVFYRLNVKLCCLGGVMWFSMVGVVIIMIMNLRFFVKCVVSNSVKLLVQVLVMFDRLRMMSFVISSCWLFQCCISRLVVILLNMLMNGNIDMILFRDVSELLNLCCSDGKLIVVLLMCSVDMMFVSMMFVMVVWQLCVGSVVVLVVIGDLVIFIFVEVVVCNGMFYVIVIGLVYMI